MEAKFIAFEGGDASGKTTQAKRVSDKLNAVFTREPGGTPVGESLRSILLDPAEAVALRAEALLMAASRAQLVHDVIKPALSNGQHVVTDRFLSSSRIPGLRKWVTTRTSFEFITIRNKRSHP